MTLADSPEWFEIGHEEVAAGTHRVPLPLINEPRAVNVYVLERSDGGLTLVDAGERTKNSQARLESSLRTLGYRVTDIRDLLVTHVHRDHYGLASWLRSESGVTVRLGVREASSIAAIGRPGWRRWEAQLDEARRGGAAAVADLVVREAMRDGGGEWVAPDQWIVDDEILELGGRTLCAISTPGHTQGHLVFVDDSRQLLFSGDHILPDITSSVGLEAVPGRSPLQDFLASLSKVRRLGVLKVLPAHGPVSPSSHRRVDELIRHHEARLEAVHLRVRNGLATAQAVAQSMTWTRQQKAYSHLSSFNQMLAVCEVAAHLRLLADRGQLTETVESGVSHYVAAAPDSMEP